VVEIITLKYYYRPTGNKNKHSFSLYSKVNKIEFFCKLLLKGIMKGGIFQNYASRDNNTKNDSRQS